MKQPTHLLFGLIATLAVVLVVTLTMTTSQGTKKTISESIPHGANEKPIRK